MDAHKRSGIGMTSQRTRRRLIERLRQQGIQNPSVLASIEHTPRHLFIDDALSHRAYDDTALPIGFSQTISQPYIVARMTELLLPPERGSRTKASVLEIGTGSAYQTAILASLFDHVYSIERINALHEQAQRRCRSLGLHNVRLRHGDGFSGWLQHAPYEAILVTAAPESIPDCLLEQLNPEGGRLVIPVGNDQQVLRLIIRDCQNFDETHLEAVRFVPLVEGSV